MHIERCTKRTFAAWIALRHDLWPHAAEAELRAEAETLLRRRRRAVAFLASTADGVPMGFAEATLRTDYVNGSTTSPVVFLEGLYVGPKYRRRGVARCLCTAIEAWATALGCTELASDTWLDSIDSQRVHVALHFAETERVVYFRKPLGRSEGDSHS
jgi:aminoglycoside 6'-N-acetyltransferase I